MQVLCTIMYAQPRTPRGICIHYDGSMGMRGAKCALGHKWSCSLLLVYHRLWSWWKDYLQTWILPCPQNIPNWKSFLKRSKSHNALSTYKVYISRLNRHLNWVNNLFKVSGPSQANTSSSSYAPPVESGILSPQKPVPSLPSQYGPPSPHLPPAPPPFPSPPAEVPASSTSQTPSANEPSVAPPPVPASAPPSPGPASPSHHKGNVIYNRWQRFI